MQGTIKKVVRDRGFGFIHADDGREIFFHRSSLQQPDFDTLKEPRVRRGARAEKGREPSTCEMVGPEIAAP
jgi:cold shock CspA family protein